ncbi:Hypothetical protein FKW44_011885, partial [Caligus rogercresseyi]
GKTVAPEVGDIIIFCKYVICTAKEETNLNKPIEAPKAAFLLPLRLPPESGMNP